ncbi:MAG: hypothetical protein Kow0069_25850 [Promethearchaeota archaeon]
MRVSDPKTFVGKFGNPRGRGQRVVVADYFNLGVKTDDGDRVLVYLPTSSMGWTGALERSKVFYRVAGRGRETRTSLRDPRRFVGKRVEVTGAFHMLSAAERKYRMNQVTRVVLELD